MTRASFLAMGLLCVVSIATAQPSDLQRQLQELKDQYAAITRTLEQRIAALEQQIDKQSSASKEGTVSFYNALILII